MSELTDNLNFEELKISMKKMNEDVEFFCCQPYLMLSEVLNLMDLECTFFNKSNDNDTSEMVAPRDSLQLEKTT